jgi:hypothetical protein
MIRAACGFLAASLLVAIPATAQGATYYAATPVSAPAKDSMVVRSTVWHCSAGQCVAAKGETRDAIVCQAVAEQLGKLTAFTAGGKSFDAAALDSCNAKAH